MGSCCSTCPVHANCDGVRYESCSTARPSMCSVLSLDPRQPGSNVTILMAHSDPVPVPGYWASPEQPDFMIQVPLLEHVGRVFVSVLPLA